MFATAKNVKIMIIFCRTWKGSNSVVFIHNTHFEMWYLYIGKDTWEKLSAEEQEIFQTTAKELAEARFEAAPAETADFEQKLQGNGIEIIEYTDEELDTIAKEIRKNIWPELEKEYGKELFERVTKGIDY
ncbi:MAG: hypothetical protein ACQEXB_28005 [Bacillota bacterium]